MLDWSELNFLKRYVKEFHNEFEILTFDDSRTPTLLTIAFNDGYERFTINMEEPVTRELIQRLSNYLENLDEN